MACRDVFPACPAEMLSTLWLKTWELPLDRMSPSHVGNVCNRPVSFQVWSVGIYGLSRGVVLLLNYDGYSIGQYRRCDRQAKQIHNKMVSRWADEGEGGPNTLLRQHALVSGYLYTLKNVRVTSGLRWP